MRGKIVKSISNLYTVLHNNQLYSCNASSKLKRYKNQLVIGDSVIFEILSEKKGYITEINERKNIFTRPKVSNVEYALLVFSIVEPTMNWNLLDKFLISCESNFVEPIIIITKTDLSNDTEVMNFKNKVKYYENYYNLFYNSDEDIINKIKVKIGDSITFLMGQSGVGKSTLLNKIDENLNIQTNEISNKLNRGKHTTRHTELFNTNEMNLIDTPGFGMLNIENISIENLKSCFVDFFEFSKECKFGARCNHISEKNCRVKEKVVNEEIPKTRYSTYIELFKEVKEKRW